MIPVAPHATPRAPYRFAFWSAIAIAILVVAIAGNADRIDTWAAGQRTAAPPCRVTPGQVAHITVRIEAGELIAQCRIVKGRT